MILLGKIQRPRGLKGECLVQSYCQNPTDLSQYGTLTAKLGEFQPKNLHIAKIFPHQRNLVRVFFDEIPDIDTAEKFKHSLLYIARDQLPKINENEFYFTDFIGCAMHNENGELLGQCDGFANFGAGDILVYKNPKNQEIMIPFQDFVIKNIDLNQKIIVIDDKVL